MRIPSCRQCGASDIKLMFRRIFVSYLAVLLISFAVLALAFSLTVRQYLINDTVESLNRVAETLTAGTIQPSIHGGGKILILFKNS